MGWDGTGWKGKGSNSGLEGIGGCAAYLTFESIRGGMQLGRGVSVICSLHISPQS